MSPEQPLSVDVEAEVIGTGHERTAPTTGPLTRATRVTRRLALKLGGVAAAVLFAQGKGSRVPAVEDGALSDSRRLQSNLSPLADRFPEAEREVLSWAAHSIENCRKGSFRLRVVDEHKNPIVGACLSIRQVKHDFLFGGNLVALRTYGVPELDASFEEGFNSLFNLAIVPFYWGTVTNERGEVDFARQKLLIEWARSHGKTVKGHPILWAAAGLGWPAVYGRLPPTDKQRAHLAMILNHYSSDVSLWDVVNEPLHFPAIQIDEPYRRAREWAPRAHLIVNDFGALNDPGEHFLRFLQSAIFRKVPFDGIGLQAHEPGNMAFPLASLLASLNRFATLGKRIHLSELAFPSDGSPVTGSTWLGNWTETVQADYAEAFYRVAFAHPSVDSIVWWLVTESTWRPHGALLRADLSRKPVFDRILDLLRREWHTTLLAITDERGEVEFRAFFGTYQIVATDGRVEISARLNMTRDETRNTHLVTFQSSY